MRVLQFQNITGEIAEVVAFERSEHARTQIDELVEMLPFNRVALLDVIVNPPLSGTDGQAWMAAAATAVNSLQQMMPALTARLPPDSPAGHFVVPWGAVAGGTESCRGTGLRFSSALPQRTRDSTIRLRKRGGANLRTTSGDFWQNTVDRRGFPRRVDGRK